MLRLRRRRAGSEARAPDSCPWRVAVERPIPGVREVETVVALKDLAVATSGDYRNFFESEGGSILDTTMVVWSQEAVDTQLRWHKAKMEYPQER